MTAAGTTWSAGARAGLVAAALAGVAAAAAPDQPLVVKRLFPAGGTAGSAVVVKAEGTFPRWPVQVWTDRPGTSWRPLEEPGAFEVTVAAEGSLGVHRVRLFDAGGAAAVRRFVVGREAEAAEAEPNDRLAEAQRVESLPVTINGGLEKAGDVDGFRVALAAGQTLVAALDAHGGVGSPVDAVLELVGDSGGYLARNHDARGLDPRIAYTARRSGDVVLRVYGFPAVPDSTIGLAGGSDCVYRLTLANGPTAAAAVPPAVVAGGTTRVAAVGWGLPVPGPECDVAPPPGASRTWVAFAGVAGTVELPVVAVPVTTAVASTAAEPPAVAPPVVVGGWFDAAGREAVARISARHDAALRVRVEARGLGLEADPTLEIRDAAGAVVAEQAGPDADFSWQPPADGDFALVLRDRRGAAGPGHAFLVSLLPDGPELRATTKADAVAGRVGGTVDVAIAVQRLHGWEGPVEFVLVDPPAGISAAPAVSAAEGDTAKKVTLSIAATAAYAGPLSIGARRPAAAGVADAPVATVLAGDEKLPVLWLTITPAAS